jgi:hypothetical protein
MEYPSKFPRNSSQNQEKKPKIHMEAQNPNHPKHSCEKLAVLEVSYYLISNYTTEPNNVYSMPQKEKLMCRPTEKK